jgi:predicted small lipoprotein YifL
MLLRSLPLLLLALPVGCGLKGPLYLPEPATVIEVHAPGDSTPSEDAVQEPMQDPADDDDASSEGR